MKLLKLSFATVAAIALTKLAVASQRKQHAHLQQRGGKCNIMQCGAGTIRIRCPVIQSVSAAKARSRSNSLWRVRGRSALICRAAVGNSCLPDLSETAHSSGMLNTLSSGLPGLYRVKSARYSSAANKLDLSCCVRKSVNIAHGERSKHLS